MIHIDNRVSKKFTPDIGTINVIFGNVFLLSSLNKGYVMQNFEKFIETI
jgi:hypothetical protein